mgnify:CR=1 FL=1
MRRALYLLLLFTLPLPMQTALAQDKLPAGLQPVPEPPPPPPGYEPTAGLEPEVTITTRGEDKAEEFRVGGKLYMIKVTPKHGVPYYLVDDKGGGGFTRMDNPDVGLSVPQWVLFKF